MVVGDTLKLDPVPTEVPPHEPLYHFQLPPAPNLPPLILNVLLWPTHIVEVPLMLVAGTEVSLMVIVVLTQLLVLQPPTALTKIVCVPIPKAAVV